MSRYPLLNLYREASACLRTKLGNLFLEKFDSMRLFFSLILLLSLSLTAHAQDRITMMSGIVVPCEIVDDLGIEIRYIAHKKFAVRYFPSQEAADMAEWKTRFDGSTWCPTPQNTIERIFEKGKKDEHYTHRSDIFSMQKAGQEEEILYALDDVLGDWMTVDEMRIYMAGEQDARDNFKANGVFYAGMPVGAVVAYLAQGGLILTLGGPVLYTLLQLAPNIRIKEETITNLVHQYNEIYALGYERVARSKQMVQALKGSAIGMVLGLVGYFVYPLEE